MTPTPTKWPGKWPMSHFREWPFIRGSPVFCTKLTEWECVLVPSSEYMTDLRSLNQYITDQEQEEHRLQRGIWSQICCTINVSNADRSVQAQSQFTFKPNGSSGWHSVFHNMKQCFFSPPPLYGVLFLRVTPSIQFASTHLCTWLEEGTVIQSTMFFLRM